jgi:hypothetical protein
MREAPRGDDEPRAFELGVCAYGPHGDRLAGRLSARIRCWDRDGRSSTDTWIEVHPAGTASDVQGHLVAEKRHTRVIVHTAGPG